MGKKKQGSIYFSTFSFFYSYLGKGMFAILFLNILISVFDAIGLSMLLPLFQLLNKSGSTIDISGMGRLEPILETIQNLGLSLNLLAIMGIILVLFTVKGIIKYVSKVYIIILEQSFIRKMRIDLLRGLNQINFKKFMSTDSGQIQNTMTGEIERIASAFSNYMGILKSLLMAVVYLTFALLINIKFSLLVFAIAGVSHLFFKMLYKRTRSVSKGLTAQNHAFQGLVSQHTAHFKYLRSSGTIDKFAKKMEGTILKIEHSRKRLGMLSSIGTSVSEPIAIFLLFVIIWIQVQVFGGSLGSIVLSLLIFFRILASLVGIQSQWNQFLTRSGSIENVKDFKGQLISNRFKDGQTLFENLQSGIFLKDLSFNYGQEPILKNINLDIHKNQTVSFVGESGSGKTTLVSLITGLMMPSNGNIYIDEFDIQSLKIDTYQKRIGYVSQDSVIFDDTLYNNITFWDKDTPENRKRFEKCIKQAALFSFYEELKKRGDTLLGNNGINVSGGQKQRICIARELYKDIDILILDEATSALDSETENAIQKSIDQLKGEYTLLIVAHRLSTIKNSDKIVFMDKGVILNVDNFEGLLKKQESFRKMVELQGLT